MITLHDITTRELLGALRSRSGYCDDYYIDEDMRTHTFSRMAKGGVEETVAATRAEIRAVLRGREHIPGKKQSATLRKVMAKHGCSKEEAWAKHGDEFYPADRRPVSKEYYKTMVKFYGRQYAAKKFVIKG